jgi:predicted transport protein
MNMTLQAYLDNIQVKTGKTPEDFRVLAEQKGMLKEGVKTGEIVAWLKNDYGLGHGHAMAIVLTLQTATQPQASDDEKVDRLFKGDKARWRLPYDELIEKINEFGEGFSADPTNTYISLLRKGKKFAIVQLTSDRLDIGIKLKGKDTTERFEAAGNWNAMVTHRVSITDSKQIDAEVMTWLKKAFDAAIPEKSKVVAKRI